MAKLHNFFKSVLVLHIVVAGKHIKHDFYVVSGIITDAVIGADIIKKLGIVPMLLKGGFTFQNLLLK
jgi:hypothetical protein